MKVFIGRSRRLWVVEPNKGRVRKLPLTLSGLLFWGLFSIGAGAFALNFLNYAGLSPKVWLDVVQKAESAAVLDKKSEQLQALVSRLQQEKEQATRLNMRLANKLENLEGALGSVAQDLISEPEQKQKSYANKSDNKSNSDSRSKLYKPASLGLGQRLSIRKVDRLIGQLRQLPHHPPVEYPTLNSRFGHRHSPNGIGSSFHRGVDFSLKRSDKVLAAGSGTVVKVSYMRGFGNYIDIKHSKDIVTRYAHLNSSSVREGQKVSARQMIGIGGSTGSATGKHLHFEVLVKGRARDPMLFLSLPKKLQLVLKQSQKSSQIG
jgi:murein DD-endopeptidase MepM/ murein hydrolase activator NlpD